MKKSFLVLALLCSSASAYSQSLVVKPEIIYSNAQLQIGDEKWTDAEGESFEQSVPNSKFVKGYGGALNLEYALDDRWRVGGGLGYVSYNQDHGANKPNFTDMFAKAGVSYDFLKIGNLSTYVAGGLSYHMVNLKTEKDGDVSINPEAVQLLNYDTALGARLQASESVSLGLEYRVTNTLDMDKMKVKYASGDTRIDSKVTKVKLNTNEIVTSLSYQL